VNERICRHGSLLERVNARLEVILYNAPRLSPGTQKMLRETIDMISKEKHAEVEERKEKP
jgi:hypothetical protein